MSMQDGSAIFQGSSFGEQRRSATSSGGRTPKQSLVGQIIEYQVGARLSSASLKTDRVKVRLMHPVPAWGIEAPDESGQYPVITVMQTKKPDARAYDLHSMKWGGKNPNMVECELGSLVLFENCYWIREGRSFDEVTAPSGGMAVADYLTPYARPVELEGNPDKELPPTRYVFPYVPAMILPGYIDKVNPRNSSQRAIISLGGLEGAITTIGHAYDERMAIEKALEIAAPYGTFGNLGVLALVRKDLDRVAPEARTSVAEQKANSYATDAWARRLRAAVTPDGTPYLISCSRVGMERLQDVLSQSRFQNKQGPTIREISRQAIFDARQLNDIAQKRMITEETFCGGLSDVGYFEVYLQPDAMQEIVDLVPGDMQVFSGPAIGRYEVENSSLALGMPYYEGVRQVMSSLATKAMGKSFGQTAIDDGCIVEFLPILEVRLLPSLTAGHPEKRASGTLDVPYRLYEILENGEAQRSSQPADVTLADGRIAQMAGVGFAMTHIALSFAEKVGQWRVRGTKIASAGAVPVKATEVLTPSTSPEFAAAFTGAQHLRQGVMKLVTEARYAPRPEKDNPSQEMGGEASLGF